VQPAPDKRTAKCRYFKYASDDPLKPRIPGFNPVAGVDDALTTLYVPYRCSLLPTGTRIGPMGRDDEAMGEPSIRPKHANSDSKNIITVLENNQNGKFTATGKNTVSLVGSIKYRFGDPVRLSNGRLDINNPVCYKQMRFDLLCNLVCTKSAYIGAELFENKLCRSKNITAGSLTNPARLIGPNGWDLKLSDGPRMYIVAGGQTIIGNTPLYDGGLTATASPFVSFASDPVNASPSHDIRVNFHFGNEIKVVNKGEGFLGKGIPFPPPFLGSKKKNAPSICCIIISSLRKTGVPDPPPETSFQILHFLGGDSLFDQEGGLASWLSNGFTPSWKTESLAMKLSQQVFLSSTNAF
jgi:hypothetical protein